MLSVCFVALGMYIIRQCFKPKPLAPLPPGPAGLPVIGNITDMPTEKEWLTFAEWGKKYGGICSVKLLGRSMIIVNDVVIMDELDRQGSIFSNRPRLPMGGDLLGFSDNLVLLTYGQRLRNYRKHIARSIGSQDSMKEFLPMIELQHRRFLRRLVSKPESLNTQLRTLTGSIILMLTYGIEAEEEGDPFVALIERSNANFIAATIPGAYLVDVFPFLLHLPEWLPGMGFKQVARKWAKDTAAMIEAPYAYTKKQMADGTAPKSFVSSILEQESTLTPDEVRDIKFIASSMYGGGADTTVSAEYAFFLAMVLNPDVQKKAQTEIDSVVGTDRLPGFIDRDQLPYVNAIVTEILRWNSITATGVPHTAMEDGVVSGYLIPKGAIIMTNLWNMLHDPDVYPEPFNFDPTRFIATPEKPAQRDPRTICFGYGRRICPGILLADASLFMTVAKSLAVFDITKAIENSVEITPVYESTSGLVNYPMSFKCTIKPRSDKASALIDEEYLASI